MVYGFKALTTFFQTMLSLIYSFLICVCNYNEDKTKIHLPAEAEFSGELSMSDLLPDLHGS